MKAITLGIAVIALTASAADAGIRQRQANQLNRISNGVASGALKPGETARLLGGQAVVAGLRGAARADGIVRPGERAFIRSVQTFQSNRIYRLKHN